jgi:hypothetical protein
MKKVYLLFFASLLLLGKTNAQLVVFGDDYAPGVSFAAFGGSTNAMSLDNTEYHSGTASLKINVTSGYTGGAFVSATPKDLSTYNAVTFWAKESSPYLLDAVGLGNNATTTVYAVERNGVALTSGWVKYYVPIPVASKLTAETGLFHFAEGSGEGAYTIWIDDVQYENVIGGVIGTPTASFATETQNKEIGATFGANGTTSTFPVNSVNQAMQTAKAYFTWTSSNTAVATIDAEGVGTGLSAGSTTVTGTLGAVTAAGTLTVNISAAVSPSTAAPTPPIRNAGDVISLFSGAYTEVAGTDWFPNWSQSTVVTDVSIAGNATKKYSTFNYQGVQFASAINASGMTKLHIDLWTPDCTAFEVYPIVTGQPEQKVTVTPVAGWNSFDISLSSYTIPLSSIIQLKFVGAPSSGSTVFLDNIYFYKEGVVISEPATAAPTPTRNAAGVISLFSNAYTDVPVNTWSTDWDNANVEDVQIAGNDTKKYTSLVFSGTEFTAPTIDATTMDHFHVDVWTPGAAEVKVKLVDFGANGTYDGGGDDKNSIEYVLSPAPTPGAWASYDIPLTSFTGLDTKQHLAQLIFVSSTITLFVDNVYLFNTALPVSFTGFTATRKNNTALLQWSTAFELNNKGFSIERSSDATNWKQINFVNGAVSGTGARTYTATDLSPAAGTNYYRIKQIDIDGHATYSTTQTLSFDKANAATLVLFPNPAKDKVTLTIGAINGNNARYTIISADGKIAKSGTFGKAQANTIQTLDVSNLQRGVYIVQLSDGITQQTAKLLLN